MIINKLKQFVSAPIKINSIYWFSSSQTPSHVILIRHAQSVFNAKCHRYPETQIYSKEAEKQFHHDPNIIDCPLTEAGYKSIKKQQFKNFFQDKNSSNTVFFVSPMLRALQTAEIVLQAISQKYQIMVLPQLSEVLSKICDFSSGINDKKQQFTGFNFRYFDEWIIEKGLCQYKQNWQDPFLDYELRNSVDLQSSAGRRYLSTLKQVFPRPLESAEKCRIRSIQGFKKIYEISNKLKYKNAVVISHNRILKNIQTHLRGIKANDFENLQIRKVKIPSDVAS